MSRLIRWILTGAILVEVWFHSHWSVALTLTGLCIANEMQAALAKGQEEPS